MHKTYKPVTIVALDPAIRCNPKETLLVLLHGLDIFVLKPDWIEAVRLKWVEGGMVDIAALAEEHRLPTFSGLRICVTGFDEGSS